MMMPGNAMFGTIEIRPSPKQWVIDHYGVFFLTVAGYVLILMSAYPKVVLLLPFALTLHLLYQLWFMKRMRFTVTDEILIYEYGVFNKRLEYIELYRIIDFRETISFEQTMLGIKSVTLLSGDRTTPRLIIPGIDRQYPLVPTIRERVEATKQRKRIYEFTNR